MKNIIYQVLPRLWGNGKMSAFDDTVLHGLKSSGFDCIWFTGIPKHATGKDFVKGDPGCPYAISDWKDVNPYLADNPEKRIEEFSALVSRTHHAGMKVLVDFIPNHVARDYQGTLPHFDWCDGDWTDTLKIDWSSPATVPEMISILEFWMRLGVDGFRCDMVELVPCNMLGIVIDTVRSHHAEAIFIAEVYNRENYRRYLEEAHFDLLYDKSGSYDILRGIREQSWSAEGLTWNWQWLSDIQPRMLNFLENHDEQRVPFWSGNSYLPGLAFSMLFNTSSFMLYFGEEIGEAAETSSNGRTSIFNIENNPHLKKLPLIYSGREGLTEEEGRVLARVQELLELAHKEAFASGNVWDLCYLQKEEFDRHRLFAFLRYNDSEMYVVVCNFSDTSVCLNLEFPGELKNMFGGRIPEMYVPALDYAVISL